MDFSYEGSPTVQLGLRVVTITGRRTSQVCEPLDHFSSFSKETPWLTATSWTSSKSLNSNCHCHLGIQRWSFRGDHERDLRERNWSLSIIWHCSAKGVWYWILSIVWWVLDRCSLIMWTLKREQTNQLIATFAENHHLIFFLNNPRPTSYTWGPPLSHVCLHLVFTHHKWFDMVIWVRYDSLQHIGAQPTAINKTLILKLAYLTGLMSSDVFGTA